MKRTVNTLHIIVCVFCYPKRRLQELSPCLALPARQQPLPCLPNDVMPDFAEDNIVDVQLETLGSELRAVVKIDGIIEGAELLHHLESTHYRHVIGLNGH